ncbi:hypothetical protein SAICODRAFT_29408 [Saitoella complicata NRRL Y-17804]|uniref:Uncharacterized protein n=1 Tax=Saitoella complicata (strain BCRC 22490 / CBS 7301 / JCM 7358 / NBRC 10748 / NRRL Y-17804) TaxID=698492 RepID=A0A0E9NQP2_SAICN|nr:uncharacterized protein SAICODRAFT_29408 [Saitoella complicata NRRL Y-17804]ODQ54741.1 hypothetical protein SAICODRAFT_29408 [Saitoella complicata NRRL Y-17804]GAO51986.1 hypothetical protein G7K_6074-t1 [Saitoella complicata NRRL Y-17804]
MSRMERSESQGSSSSTSSSPSSLRRRVSIRNSTSTDDTTYSSMPTAGVTVTPTRRLQGRAKVYDSETPSSPPYRARYGSSVKGSPRSGDEEPGAQEVVHSLREELMAAQSLISSLERTCSLLTLDLSHAEDAYSNLSDEHESLLTQFRAEKKARREEGERVRVLEEEVAGLVGVREELEGELGGVRERLQELMGRGTPRVGELKAEEGKGGDLGFAPPTPTLDSPLTFTSSMSLYTASSLSSPIHPTESATSTIEALQTELADTTQELARLSAVEDELHELQEQNARLVEEVSEYQMLLTEKTMDGSFTAGEFMSEFASSPPISPTHSTPASPTSDNMGLGLGSLANEFAEVESRQDAQRIVDLEKQVKHLTEGNKALTTYISNIIQRLLDHRFEAVLSKDEVPPPSDATIRAGEGGAGVNSAQSTPARMPPTPSTPLSPLHRSFDDTNSSPTLDSRRTKAKRFSFISRAATQPTDPRPSHARTTSEATPLSATIVHSLYRAPAPSLGSPQHRALLPAGRPRMPILPRTTVGGGVGPTEVDSTPKGQGQGLRTLRLVEQNSPPPPPPNPKRASWLGGWWNGKDIKEEEAGDGRERERTMSEGSEASSLGR